ncbi:hypothetical protein JNJ66_01455 [Candidatus Saccharibacteria bacterium]|nr:hypothetical protein [Candidatus Saccharibacteria bacterium]
MPKIASFSLSATCSTSKKMLLWSRAKAAAAPVRLASQRIRRPRQTILLAPKSKPAAS